MTKARVMNQMSIIVAVMLGLLAAVGIWIYLKARPLPPPPNRTPEGFLIKMIDDCEYLFYGQGLTHKGNCKYCKERDE